MSSTGRHSDKSRGNVSARVQQISTKKYASGLYNTIQLHSTKTRFTRTLPKSVFGPRVKKSGRSREFHLFTYLFTNLLIE